MPYSGDCHLVSCARDGQVRLAELSAMQTCKTTRKLASHRGAAHKVNINMIWIFTSVCRAIVHWSHSLSVISWLSWRIHLMSSTAVERMLPCSKLISDKRSQTSEFQRFPLESSSIVKNYMLKLWLGTYGGLCSRLGFTKESDRKVALYSIHANPFKSYEYCVGGRDHFLRWASDWTQPVWNIMHLTPCDAYHASLLHWNWL